METEKELNAKILTITMTIKNQYPELSKYLEEIPMTIPDEKKSEITPLHLKQYFESLDSLLNNYIMKQASKIQ